VVIDLALGNFRIEGSDSDHAKFALVLMARTSKYLADKKAVKKIRWVMRLPTTSAGELARRHGVKPHNGEAANRIPVVVFSQGHRDSLDKFEWR